MSHAILLLLLIVSLLGCAATPQDRIIGAWTADADRAELPPVNIGKTFEDRARGAIKGFVFKLRSDGTFAASIGPAAAEGRYQLEGNKIHFKLKNKLPHLPLGIKFTDATGEFNPRFNEFTVSLDTPAGPLKVVFMKA